MARMRFREAGFVWLALLVPALARPAGSAGITGHWVGFEERGGRKLEIAVDLSGPEPPPPARVEYFCPMDPQVVRPQPGTCPICGMALVLRAISNASGRFTAESQGVAEYPFDTVTYAPPNLHVELGNGDTVFDGRVSGDAITGTIRQKNGAGTFALRREKPPAPPWTRRDVTFSNGAVKLSGTYFVPTGERRHAAVVLVHGSGPQTRWGTPLFFAERFAAGGIAALAFDKRGSGESSGDWRTATDDDLAGDVAAAVDFVSVQPDVDPRRVGIFGHSEGAMIAPLVATRSPNVAFVIAADGHAGPLADQELYRVHGILQDAGFDETDARRALAFFATWMNVAATGRGWDLVEALLPAAEKEKWFPLVSPPDRNDPIWKAYPARAAYDSARYWSSVRVPVLLAFGEADRTVDPSVAIPRTKKALEAAGNRGVTVHVFPKARHNLTIPGSENPFEWWRLAPGCPDFLITWVHGLSGHPPAR